MSKPWKCPVCCGQGTVAQGFYDGPYSYGGSSSAMPESCRSCDGKGIVWEERTVEAPLRTDWGNTSASGVEL